MAQWLMCLPHKPETQNSDPWDTCQCCIILSLRRVRQGTPEQPGWHDQPYQQVLELI